MKLDQLPTEVLTHIFGQLAKGDDLASVSHTNKALYEVCLYDSLWTTPCLRILERIQGSVEEDIQTQKYRAFYFDQVRINQHVAHLVDELVSGSDEKCKQEAVDAVWNYGIRARDALIDAKQDPTRSEKADSLLQMIKHKQALDRMKDISEKPDHYQAVDLLSTVDSYYTGHELNPSKDNIFGDIINEVRTSDDIKFCSNPRNIQKAATVLAEVLFDHTRVKTSCGKTSHTHCSNLLTPVLEEGIQGVDTINACVYSYIGAMYGLRISPVMLSQNGKFIDSNFARVDDPSKEEGFFLINMLSRIVLSGVDMADMLEPQRSIRLVSMNSPPSLPILAASTALKRFKPQSYATQIEQVNSLYASSLLAALFTTDQDYFHQVQASTQPKSGSSLTLDYDTLRNELTNNSTPSLYKQTLIN
jgi:hypothetical protein